MEQNVTPVHSIWIPALYRDLTSGEEVISIGGATVGEVVSALNERFPGIEDRLCEDGRIRPHIAVSIDGEVSFRGLRHKLTESTEIHFVPALAGG